MKLSEKTKAYWDKADWEDLEKAKSIAELFSVARRIMSRMPKPMVQVCGPISTGGLGSIEKNLEKFNEIIIQLQDQGLNIFDQMPFELPMKRLREEYPGEYLEDILLDFYAPLFETGFVGRFYFIEGWESSTGAKWEHEKAKELGIEIIYL